MRREGDALAGSISHIIKTSREPLETKEIEERLSKSTKYVTRTKVLYRLNNLRGEGVIQGKFVGPGKGVWIWWTSAGIIAGGKL